MQISKEHIDDLTLTLTMSVEPEDYKAQVNKELKTAKKQANLKGFRKGEVPMGVVKKMFGTKILADQLDKIITEEFKNYLKENELETIVQPMALPTEQRLLLSEDVTYSFQFLVGLKPEKIDLPFVKNDSHSFIRYVLADIPEEEINKEVERIQARYGKPEEQENNIEEKDVLTVTFREIDAENNLVEDGIESVTMIMTDMIKEDAIKELVLSLKKEETFEVNVFEAFDKSKEDVAKVLLGRTEEEIAASETPENYQVTIDKVSRLAPAALEDELFEQVFGKEGVEKFNITDEASFRVALRTDLENIYKNQCENVLELQIRTALDNDVNPPLPEAFIDQYIQQKIEAKDEKELAEIRHVFADQIKRQLIVEKLIADYGLQLTEEDIYSTAVMDIRNRAKEMFGGQQMSYNWIYQQVEESLKEDQYRNEVALLAMTIKGIKAMKKEDLLIVEEQVAFEDFEDTIKAKVESLNPPKKEETVVEEVAIEEPTTETVQTEVVNG